MFSNKFTIVISCLISISVNAVAAGSQEMLDPNNQESTSVDAPAQSNSSYTCSFYRRTSGWTNGSIVKFEVEATSADEASRIGYKRCVDSGWFGGNMCYVSGVAHPCVKVIK